MRKRPNLADGEPRCNFGQQGSGEIWSTVGVSTNVIDASYNALHDSLTYKLWREGRRA